MAKGDVYWVEIPYPKGRAGKEQAGRRPAIAVQTDESHNLPTVIIVPTTTNLNTLRFPHTLEVQPSHENGFTKTSVLLVFQIRAIDRRRIGDKIGTLEKKYLNQLWDELRILLDL